MQHDIGQDKHVEIFQMALGFAVRQLQVWHLIRDSYWHEGSSLGVSLGGSAVDGTCTMLSISR